MRPNAEPDTDGEFSVEEEGCAVLCAIDTIALGLSALGLKGGIGKKVARKMYANLTGFVKDPIKAIMKNLTIKKFPGQIKKILNLIYNSLSCSDLKNSFSELGWWDAIIFSLNFVAFLLALAQLYSSHLLFLLLRQGR